jgi:DUF3040 family protein
MRITAAAYRNVGPIGIANRSPATAVVRPPGRRAAPPPSPGELFRWRSRACPAHKLAVRANAGKSVLAWGFIGGTVPLSEHERRQLEQIEAALRAGDPRFADAVRAADPRVHYRRRVIAAALGFLVGVGLLLAGVAVNVILIAVAGFVVMLACSLWAITSYRRMTGSTTGRAPAAARGVGKDRRASARAGSGLMGRLEERWRRRQQGGR